MTLTILIDLDDTLLDNDMGVFLPNYLNALGNFMASTIDPNILSSALLRGTSKMFENNSIDRTLKSVFNDFFYSDIDFKEDQIGNLINDFYKNEFPKLKNITKPIPEAKTFIDRALERKYRIGIATNPLFPRTAIIQRLQWAGLDSNKYDFALIPSYADFHFAKPNPAYFAEFISRIGWPEDPIIMIGNDPEHDIQGAKNFGIPAFQIIKHDISTKSNLTKRYGQGSINSVFDWIDRFNVKDLSPNFEKRTSIIAQLKGIPAAIDTIYNQTNTSSWNAHPNKNERGLLEILCHVRDVEKEVNIPRIKKILNETNPFISETDIDQWLETRKYQEQNKHSALPEYLNARKETIALIENMSDLDWKRPANHALLGTTSLHELIRMINQHDRLIIRQIHQVITEPTN